MNPFTFQTLSAFCCFNLTSVHYECRTSACVLHFYLISARLVSPLRNYLVWVKCKLPTTMITTYFCVAHVAQGISSKLQLVTRFSNNNEKPLKKEAEYEKPSLQWCQCTVASVSALIAGSSCNQKLAGRRAAKRGCSMFRLFKASLWCNHNHIWPSQWAGDETDVSGKKCGV